ncbi:leucine-rich repeat-containing protein 34 isoform X4 [Lagopus leucura]|uniref:leucine-rich repeat-containing protein 34 isoform X4 n=1 Tax=Lagopus leucura TaxID=30410 RepID=UPI001C67CD54|nr:leucine-rich repeat-containing protein 34 isoform X4 [Lagopus leucura]
MPCPAPGFPSEVGSRGAPAPLGAQTLRWTSAVWHVMSVPPDLHQQYLQTCQNLSQPENHFVARVLQEADKNDNIRWTKGITLKIAGNNRLVPVQRVTDEDVQVLASVLRCAVCVTGLDLRYNDLTDVGVRHVATFLQGLPVMWCRTEVENSTLRYLNLMFNDIGTSGAELIANALHSNETLLHLRLTGNKIGNKGGMYFASMLQVNCTLEKLDLGDCDVEETTVHIALMLKNNSSLVELHLCKHEIKSFGVERLCEALYENCSLRYLDLSCNKVTREDVKFLGELLKQNQTLEILDLNSNRIEDDGAIYLSEALALYNRTLKALSVVSNNISGKGLAALSQAMKINVELSYIYIWGNNFDEAACMAFSELIQAGRLKPDCTDVEPYEVDGHIHLAELSHGLKKHYYWTPSYGEVKNAAANASLAIAAVSECF